MQEAGADLYLHERLPGVYSHVNVAWFTGRPKVYILWTCWFICSLNMLVYVFFEHVIVSFCNHDMLHASKFHTPNSILVVNTAVLQED